MFSIQNIKMISGIVLAAGESKRMGRTKQILEIGRKSILEWVIDNIKNSRVNEIIVVIGHKSNLIEPIISGKGIKIIFNPDYKEGMSSSIKAGLKGIDPGSKGFFIFLGDQPFIGKGIIDTLIDRFNKSNKGIVVPVYRGIRGHPVIFNVKYKEEFMKLTGDIGGRYIIEKNKNDLLEVDISTEEGIIDIDNMDDYLKYKKFKI